MIPNDPASGYDRDPADFPNAGYTPDVVAAIESFKDGAESIVQASLSLARTIDALDELHEQCPQRSGGPMHGAVEFIADMLRSLLTARSKALEIYAWAFAVGLLELEGKTMTRAAAECGVTRSMLSKRARQIRDRHHLGANRYTKSEASRARYRDAQLTKHWRYHK